MTLARLRKSAFKAQSGCCYYCHYPMWENDPELFARTNKIPLSEAWRLQSTAEHLEAKQDGGKNTRENIVAACRWCNSQRHINGQSPGPNTYQQVVRKKVSKERWHRPPLSRIFRPRLPHPTSNHAP